jgi:trigger factor
MTTSAPAITVEDAGPCRKKLSIEIPGDQIGEKIGAAIAELEGNVTLPGFRPGKVPRKLIERRFGSSVREETKKQLVSEAYQSAIQEHELRVVGEPEGGEELAEAEIEPGKALSFSIHVEVAPEFDAPDVEGLKIKKPAFEVTDEMIDEQIERARVNEGQLEEQEKAERGDYCVGHGVLKIKSSGEVIHDIEGAVIQVPKEGDRGMILGVAADDFVKQVGSPKKGDAITVTTTGPEQHEVESVRGAELEATFEVSEVQRVIPATMDELLSKFRLSDEEALRKGVRSQLENRVQAQQQASMRQQAASRLLELVDFELPERLTSGQAARNLQRRRMDLMYQGVEPDAIEEQLAEMREASDEIARRELKLFFILDSLAREFDVRITEQDVAGAITQMALSRGVDPAQLRQELVQSGEVQGIAQQVREHKTLDRVLEKAKVEEVKPEELSETEGEAAEAKAEKKTTNKKTSKKTTKKKTSKKTSD